VFAIWINDPDPLPAVVADEHGYVRARRVASRGWLGQLARGTTFVVPEPRVVNAERALLVQELAMTWRYSVGNTYEELSFAEALDAAEVMATYGYGDVAKAILRFALRRLPHLVLVHETRNQDDVPDGLELAYATPRAWLQSGKTIAVRSAPTSFGPVSYTIARRGLRIHAAFSVPAAPQLHVRLRLPTNLQIATVHLAGKPLPVDRDTGTIDLSGRHGHFQLIVTLTHR
jgi:hypothetical protein